MLKRLALLFMLVVMPFQMVWAIPVSNYCQHEQGAAAQHFGHHFHQHHSDGKFHGKAPVGMDDDCAYCHLGGVILPLAVISPAPAPLTSMSFSSLREAMSSLPAREPERPKWTLSA
jgi:hypothetical protein